MPKPKRHKRAAVAVVGDLHSNSTVGLMPPQFRTQAGNIESGRVIRARGGGVDTVYWRVK